jgi:hypothetical protein
MPPAAVILTTHAAHRLHAADRIIALDGGRVVQDGSFPALSTASGYIADLLAVLAASPRAADVTPMGALAAPLAEKPAVAPAEDPKADQHLREIADEARQARYTGSLMCASA